MVVHKTFHRYVVRAKRGTVQSQHDSSGKFAKSAGANIRRSQEAAFKDVREFYCALIDVCDDLKKKLFLFILNRI